MVLMLMQARGLLLMSALLVTQSLLPYSLPSFSSPHVLTHYYHYYSHQPSTTNKPLTLTQQRHIVNKSAQPAPTITMNDRDAVSTFSDPEVVRIHENPSDFSLGDVPLAAQRENGMHNARTLIYEELAEKMYPYEELELVVRGFEKRVDEKVRATFFDGIRV